LADRNNTWKEEGITRTYNQQAALLIIEKGQNRYPCVHSQVLQDVLKRLNRAFVNFFGRVREGAEKKGYPRFKVTVNGMQAINASFLKKMHFL